MGCASSKQKQCPHCHSLYSTVSRSYSVHVHHPPQTHGDSYHFVALTSSTFGSLKLDHNTINNSEDHEHAHSNGKDYVDVEEEKIKEFSKGLMEAKNWSSLINEKIPKIIPTTQTRTSAGEPETINTWELMEGLEEDSPLRLQSSDLPRSFSFDCPKSRLKENDIIVHPFVSDFDPDAISSFRKSLDNSSKTNCDGEKVKDKIVVYFTSLRGVRKTYEDCCNVRMILKNVGLCVDERDVSMDSGFKEEMKELFGDGFNGRVLPKVFVGRKYVGGVNEIKRMHEEGQLEKVFECCEKVGNGGGGGGGGGCEGCGDIRFVPCERCSGSCKVYYGGKEVEEEGSGEEEGECGFQRCTDCNENGLIRCPICCY